MGYLEGKLRRRDTSRAGGEHSGYSLELEIEMSAIANAQGLIDEQVAVTGDLELVDYPERGKVLVFRATSAATMDDEDEEAE